MLVELNDTVVRKLVVRHLSKDLIKYKAMLSKDQIAAYRFIIAENATPAEYIEISKEWNVEAVAG